MYCTRYWRSRSASSCSRRRCAAASASALRFASSASDLYLLTMLIVRSLVGSAAPVQPEDQAEAVPAGGHREVGVPVPATVLGGLPGGRGHRIVPFTFC